MALLWERRHPAAAELPDLGALAEACQIAGATSGEEAARVRHGILEAVSSSPPAAIDAGESSAWLRHQDGTLEEGIHLATPPQETDPSWLPPLPTCPPPATLPVHI